MYHTILIYMLFLFIIKYKNKDSRIKSTILKYFT
nr:MAG TPA: hypothetical protein [Crassvirales sp.]